MPGKSWREVTGGGMPAAPAAAQTPLTAFPASPQATAVSAAEVSPKLAALMAEREALSSRMQALTSGGQTPDPRDAARFPVASFAQRRAEAERFAARQDALRTRTPAARAEPAQRGRLPDRFAAPMMSARDWLAQRDRQRMNIREQARDRLAPLASVAEAGRAVSSRLTGMRDQLHELDRRLESEGVSAEERAEIRREIGGDRLDDISGRVSGATRAVETPMRLVDRIDGAWQGKRDQISGALDRVGPYAAVRERRLGLDTGGSGDLFERAARARERGLQRRREARSEAAADDARRDRARRERREREAGSR